MNHFDEMEKKRLKQKQEQQEAKEADAVRIVNNAKASLAMDGKTVSKETEDIMIRYAKGELTEEEVLKWIRPGKEEN
ncbi:antitoxin VbhA family protein [Paenibacillus sp. HJGM_3]|uniref:antitoxin VbhA family protein n=1 Tax=Paenibacillus sp. HJGM_3 TaxID=3379816 RepID=UPI00385C708B